MRYLLYILVSLLWVSPSLAATWTVNTQATMANALANAQAGDVINITSGTYTNWGVFTVLHTRDATAGNRITITTDASNPATFNGQGAFRLDMRAAYWTISNLKFTGQTDFGDFLSNGATGGSLISLDGAQNVILDNIRVENVSGDGAIFPVMRLNGVRETTLNRIRNLTIDGYTQSGNGAAAIYIYGDAATNGEIRGITIENFTFSNRTVTSQSRRNHWIRVGDCCNIAYDSDVLIRQGQIEYDTTAAPRQDAIYVEASNVEITDTVFLEATGIELRRTNDSIVARNTTINPLSTLTDYWLRVYGANHTIVNNLCYTTLGSKTCIELGLGNTDTNLDGRADHPPVTGALIAHNTIDGFATSAISMLPTEIGNNDGATTVNPTNTTLLNNVIRQHAGTMVTGNSCATQFALISNNSWSGSAQAGCLTEGSNNTVAAPQWVNPAAGNYTLSTGSPLISAGTTIACVLQTEIDHEGRVRDTLPDIGAFEFGAGESVIPPEDNACADTFGTAASYRACGSGDDYLTCSFSVFLNEQSCDGLCQSFGRSCVTSYPNNLDSCVAIGAEEPCSTVRQDQICVCKLNPDGAVAPASTTRYVDTSCATPGDGTTETCGANGPWNSLEYAMEVADCAGMSSGDIISVKGSTDPQSDGSWYAGEYDQPDELTPDDACSGVIVENASGHYITLDGTVDLSGKTWTNIGSNVYECQSPDCGPPAGHPFTAWYDTGSGIEQRLDLIQSVQTCSTSLAAGTMSYNPVSRRVCAHLSDNSSPSAADYFRIPYYAEAVSMAGQDTDSVVFRKNPDLSGGFEITRYRSKGITFDASINQFTTIDGLNLSWIGYSGIGPANTSTGIATYRILNNDIGFVGQYGIEWAYDLGMAVIKRNTIHDIGTEPIFEACNGVGAGCLSSTSTEPTAAIAVNNCTPKDGMLRGTIANNSVSNLGGGATERGFGVELRDCAYGNLIDGNLVRGSVDDNGIYGIGITGIPSGQYHDNNIISNNRFDELNYGFVWDTDTVTSQAGNTNYVVGNTCRNPILGGCYVQETGTAIGGELVFKNNLSVLDASASGFVELYDDANAAHWAADFGANGFECSHSGCSGQDIATIQGVGYERNDDCTASVDCIRDAPGNNTYGLMNITEGTLNLSEGSFAIDTGQNLPQLPLDYLGTARPINAFSDIGAHEFEGESPEENLAQHHYRFYHPFEAAGVNPVAPEDISPTLFDRSYFTLRFAIGGEDPLASLYIASVAIAYQHCDPTCGDWTPVTTECTGTPLCLVEHPTRQTDSGISNELSLDGRIFSLNSRFIDDNANTVPVLVESTNQVELEFSMGFGTLMDIGDTINIRLQHSDGTSFSLYAETPSVPIGTGRFLNWR